MRVIEGSCDGGGREPVALRFGERVTGKGGELWKGW